jgi:hypothetical protein
MANQTIVTTPDVTQVINQQFFLPPQGGPQDPVSYLDIFPDSVYTKGIDSHLVKFMYAALGPAGAGWLHKNYLEARLLLEDFGIETNDLDKFYGDPIGFGRILEETYEEDPSGMIPPDKWEEIKAKDAKYRNRAIDFVNGARAGNTPYGMQLVARSGIGHEVEIIEQYRYLYDQLTDDSIGLINFGTTESTGEFVVVPRRELPITEVQTLGVTGTATGGSVKIEFLGAAGSSGSGNASFVRVAYDALAQSPATPVTAGVWAGVKEALESIPQIGFGNVIVEGGPLNVNPITITFTGELGHRDVPELHIASDELIGGVAYLTTDRNGLDTTQEIVQFSSRDKHYLFNALGRIRPVASVPTFNEGKGLRSRQLWNTAASTSEFSEVVRYVTGNNNISWPDSTLDSKYWIESGIEHKSLRSFSGAKNHYIGYHNIQAIDAYFDEATLDSDYLTDNWPDVKSTYRSEHTGRFTPYQEALYPVITSSIDAVHHADHAPADYPEPIIVTSTTSGLDNPTNLINGIYPAEYATLSGVPALKYPQEQFWASLERKEGDEYLEIDLGSVQPVNYLYFEVTQKPFNIEISYDTLDQAPSRDWQVVTDVNELSSVNSIGYDFSSLNPWFLIEHFFTNSIGEMVYTRFIRIKFSRRISSDSPFVTSDGDNLPYSIEVKNLRIARNVS